MLHLLSKSNSKVSANKLPEIDSVAYGINVLNLFNKLFDCFQ